VAPRTLPEIVEAMRANAVHYPATTLSGVLNWLVRKGKVKRWKTDKGYVYVLAQASAVPSQPLMQTQSETIDVPAVEGEEVG
jgi:predicted transcriptional regulator